MRWRQHPSERIEDGGSAGDEVLVGMEIFRRFRVVYDYLNQRIFLRPNGRYQLPFEPIGTGDERSDG